MLFFKNTQQISFAKLLKLLLAFFFIAILVLLILLMFGKENISFYNFFSKDNRSLIFDIRLPRLLADFMVGSSLALVGTTFQTFFRNPLADPYLLGLSGAAAIGVVLSYLLGIEIVFFQEILSFVCAIITIIIIYKLAGGINRIAINALILIGVGLNFFFASIITFFYAVMSDKFTKNILLWYMGDTTFINIFTVIIALSIIIFFSIMLYMESPKLNIYLLGDEITVNSGIDIKKLSLKIYILGSIITSISVSLCGAIGFVGLIIPHMVKIILGIDHRINLLGAFFFGGIFVMIIDSIFKTLFYPFEIPLGAITALIGTPVFLYLIRNKL